MKTQNNIILVIIILIMTVFAFNTKANQSDTTYVVQGICINEQLEAEKLNSYCEGFKEGFEDGYCYKEPYCIPPIPPICPVPGINEENNYRGGYNRGFITGRKKRKNE